MKSAGKIAACLAGGLALTAGLRADDTVASSGNPYATIAARNIFNLNPPAPVDATSDAAAAVKITPNGIMSVLGHWQVLFKATDSGKDQFYNLSEGQRQDDIEVVKINDKTGIVTFNNHGVMQDIPLADAPKITSSSSGSSAIPAPGAAGYNGNNNNGGGFSGNSGRGRFGGRNRSENNNSNNGNYNSGGDNNGDSGDNPNLRSVPTRNGIYQPQASTMSPEEQTVLIEAQRAQYQATGDPRAKLLPPTAMTPPANGENNESTPSPSAP